MVHHTLRRLATLVALIMMFGLAVGPALAQGSSARIRFVHAIPGAATIDVYVDGQPTASGLAYGGATTYALISAGDHQITVTPKGATNALWQQTVTAAPGAALTLVAASAATPSFLVYADDLNPLALGKARFTAIHAIAGGPTVDLVLTDGRPVIPGLEFGVAAGTLDVPAMAYDFAVVPAGESVANAILNANGVALASGTSYVLIVHGTLDQPATLLLAAATPGQTDGGYVRVMHGVANAPDVDVYLNDTLVIPSLALAGYTQHLSIPAGSYNVVAKAAGSDQTLMSTTVTVEVGVAATIAALGEPATPTLNVFVDNIAGMSADRARLSIINGLPGKVVSAVLTDGTTLVSSLESARSGDAVSIVPSTQAIRLTIAEGETSQTVEIPEISFYGGVYYNLLVITYKERPYVVVAPTSVAQGPGSAAGMTSIVAAVPTTIVQPTLPPPPVEPTATSAPTLVPAVAPTAVTSQSPIPSGPTGRVYNMDPDRNLQLRQYPSSDALSLGVIPPGTILAVNGRAGEIVSIPFSATPRAPEGYSYVDPATQLEDGKDLEPSQTWLNVTYTAPDGGTITAWANALYVAIRNERGDRMKLADLPTLPANTPGEVNGTAVTPPPLPANRVGAVVFNLDSGVNLNIRRTPDTVGEVLARVSNGTIMEFLGLSEDGDWVFVRYTAPEGGSVTGWVNSLYIQYSYNNRSIKLDEMEQRGLLEITPLETRGEVETGINPVTLPTANPTRNAYIAQVVLDPGSNLNLRRSPNANAEVLVRVPTGTELIVQARTEDEKWLLVTFEQIEGWVAAQTDTALFVRVTFNGKEAPISEIPVASDTGEIETPAPTEEFIRLAVRVTDAVVAMTGSPGGNSDGLPVLTAGQIADLLFTDGTFSYIELPDGTRGWVPAGAVQPR